MLKYGVIGAGFIGSFHAQAFAAAPGVELVGVADTNLEAARKLAADYGCPAYGQAEEMLRVAKPDMVSVCLPTFLHTEAVCLAAAHGAHVLCEKPVALTLEEIQRMGDAAQAGGVKVMAGQVLRFWPEYALIGRSLKDGSFGDVRFIDAARVMTASRAGWFSDPALSGAALFDILVHDLDYAVSLLGTDVARLYARGAQDERGGWRHMHVTLSYRSGAIVHIEASNGQPAAFPFTTRFRADCENGSLSYGFNAPVNIQRDAPTHTSFFAVRDGQQVPLTPPAYALSAQEEAFRQEAAAFARGVESGVMPIPWEETRRVMRLVHLVRESMEGAGEIVNPDVGPQ